MTTAPTSPITHLRHVGIAAPDFARAAEFYRTAWGLTQVAEDGGIAFFGSPASPENYLLRVRQDTAKRLDVVAFGVGEASDVDALAERLATSGTRIDREPGKLDTPGGGYGFRFFDPDGRLIEISSDVAERPARELEPKESIPRKLSHVVFNSTDVPATQAFYETHLGLRLSDWLADQMCFLRSGEEHHLMAIAKGPHVALNHVSFEMRGLDEYMRGTGRLVRGGHRLLWGPGRHGPGDNTFSYFFDPLGNVMEYTTELEKIEDQETWEPRVFEINDENSDQWGTANPIDEVFIPAQFNDPDQGLWHSSPV
ncbi:VOC family protein [Geodermatophilus sp. CPCC 206100]|uniref:VOC family protein n=1 Tax=Geodermatophilus sp. CPCC 206100 TaxID=3020054 RepID=UPI003AFFC0C1